VKEEVKNTYLRGFHEAVTSEQCFEGTIVTWWEGQRVEVRGVGVALSQVGTWFRL
jgi:hypothetical protein